MKEESIKTKILKRIPFIQYLKGIMKYDKIKKSIKEVDQYKEKQIEGTLTANNVNISKKKMLKKFILSDIKNKDVVHEYLNSKINIIKENFNYDYDGTKEVTLVCLVKDDKYRIQELLKYYRKLGIKRFVFLDNKSTDGTYELLYNQEEKDINLYLINDKYTTYRREAWLNLIYEHIGYEKWILCVDSDEFFSYIGQEKHTINEFATKLKNGRARCLLLDMYSKNYIFQENTNDVIENYCYFDTNTYYNVNTYKSNLILGGPRMRVFSTENQKMLCTVSKYPLFFYEEGDWQGCSHWQFPYKKNYSNEIIAVLKHYKFMFKDMEKYKKRIEEKNYASGSLEYKKYFEVLNENKKVTFYFENSEKLEDTSNLKNIIVSGKYRIKNIFDVE